MNPSVIAIVGMAGRFPGARNTQEFWRNLRDGLESIQDLGDADLINAGALKEEIANPNYVKRAAILDDVSLFDAPFFGFSPRDAAILDPQHRHFLECSWEALESAAHPPQSFPGSIGVFAGSGMNSYLIHNLLANRKLLESAGMFQLKQTGNDKDVLSTRVSYQLDLRGPSVNIQTACSTSLVAVHMACQSLLNFECDMALAGGVTIEVPHGLGYLYREGEILSRDGHCRPFDASSSGTVFSSGLGIVVLRRLEDALADGDHIHAVILGSAINNDGARKVGYLAPSVEGQAEVITEALDFAGVKADSISYVETHGTGTLVGDPIEVRALTQAFRKSTERTGYCAIGSLKSNVGHLDAAAGVSGLIKTVLALENKKLPASLHFQQPNPFIEFKDSPFFVNRKLADWPEEGNARRACVTALGIGGTNAHVVLEEAPPVRISPSSKPFHLLTVSAKSEPAADQAVANLSKYLQDHPELPLSDVAYTCQIGRSAFAHRRAMVVGPDPNSRLNGTALDRKQVASGVVGHDAPKPVFMFSGQGSQYVGMGRDLYLHEPVFRQALDHCAQLLVEPLNVDLRDILYPTPGTESAAAEKLNQTWLTQPALFSFEYSLAQWWISLGVTPVAMVGHSIGEYVAACLAGVFSLADGLAIAAVRGRLMHKMPTGSMLAVLLPPQELRFDSKVSLAAVNAPKHSVVSGPADAIAVLEQELTQQSVTTRRLYTSHAFHSAMMDPILEEFERYLQGIPLAPPMIPYLSNVSGTWIDAKQATDPAYWARHLRQTVFFSDCVDKLVSTPNRILLEVGPGNTLASLALQQAGSAVQALPSVPHPRDKSPDLRCALQTLGQMWTCGVVVDWSKLHTPGSARRVPLPTYPFQRMKHWIDPDRVPLRSQNSVLSETNSGEQSTIHLYSRGWTPVPLEQTELQEPCGWIVFKDTLGIGAQIIAKLEADRQGVVEVTVGDRFRRTGKHSYALRAGNRADYDALFSEIFQSGAAPRKLIHLWSMVASTKNCPLEDMLDRSFFSPLYLAQALAAKDQGDCEIAFVSNHLQQVMDEPIHHPERAVLQGPARTITREFPGILCFSIDIETEAKRTKAAATGILAEMISPQHSLAVALRGSQRFVETLQPLELAHDSIHHRLPVRGVYLITGGLGGLGLVIAEHLARDFHARLILVSRSSLPPEEQWESAVSDTSESSFNLTEGIKRTLRKLIEIRAIAGGLMVVSADVTKAEDMHKAVAVARQRFGEINGVFHAAGVLDDAPLLLKDRETTTRVLVPKVRGTLVLEEVLRDVPLSCFVLFSSVSSIYPLAGQIDYAAGNAFLDAFAQHRKGPFTVINWGAWQEVGMAARSNARHPLLHWELRRSSDGIVYSSEFSQQMLWLLSEHRFKAGDALVPGTGYLEMAVAALSRGALNAPVELEDVFFTAPLVFAPAASRQVQVQLKKEMADREMGSAYRFTVFAHDREWKEHATGLISYRPDRSTAHIDRDAIMARCQSQVRVFDEKHRTKQERYFEFGPRWHCLRRLFIGEKEGLAELALEERFHADVSVYLVHPALLDLATGCALYLIPGYGESEAIYLPLSYKKLRLFKSLPAKAFSHIQVRSASGQNQDVAVFDIVIFDEEGRVLAEIEGFTMRSVDSSVQVGIDESTPHSASSVPAANLIGDDEAVGIVPQEGARLLTRILRSASPTSVVAVSQPIDVPESSRPLPPKGRAPVPDSGVQNVEKTLSAWWIELLGVEKIDVDDDFFALGGHSLVGVRLFAKIKNSYRIDLEIARLFEARTIRQLATVIRQAQEPTERKTRTTLVAVQPKGKETPIFLVHAVGGDVVFYEPLARALGTEQPLYAFRSPLITQPDIRATSINELASIYVREMREFFPVGPYRIGGASFGGLVAFEMAKQLKEQGAEVDLVLLVDSMVPGHEKGAAFLPRAHAFYQRFRKLGVSCLTRRFKIEYAHRTQQMQRKILVFSYTVIRWAGRPLPLRLRYVEIDEAHRMAIARHSFTPYPGRVTLIRAAVDRDGELLRLQKDPTLGWGPLVEGGLAIHDITTGHNDLLIEPKVASLAQFIQDCVSHGAVSQ